jgi:AcrR family transcriptional regulator
MPKISDARRQERRGQILHAAWTCFQRQGLHATTMDDIIAASGLSAGAVYTYFKSKEDLILAAITTSLSGLRALLEPTLRRDPPAPPAELAAEITATIAGFAARGDFDLRRLALLGWSEAQRNRRVATLMRGFYLDFRAEMKGTALQWQRAGLASRTADPDDIAKTFLSLILGFVVQSALLGDAAPEEIGHGLAALGAGARPTRPPRRAKR